MRISSSLCALVALFSLAVGAPSPGSDQDSSTSNISPKLPLVQSKNLRDRIITQVLKAKAQKLQDFAFASPERNRFIGSPGHNATINYLYQLFKALPDYYSVYLQEFKVPNSHSNLTIPGYGNGSVESEPMTFGNPGNVAAPLVAVSNLGCEATDFPAAVEGAIALISRGNCTFAIKTLNAGAAGAVGVLVYNNVPGALYGTLGEAGAYPPTAGISQADGLALVEAIDESTLTANLIVTSEEVTTFNVIAQTKSGDQNNVLHVGAHSDSVEAGPGINDNGSGTIGILEVALQLVHFSVNNAIRFSWWSGEEEGLLGADHYVSVSSQEELDKIRLYLNFDMIASPNFKYGIYDGDGSGFNISGPPGSAEAEHLFEDYLTQIANVKHVPSEFDGRSDYGPFLDEGIACGGLDTGAEKNKTAKEQVWFGGQAGVPYDINYHGAGDQISNLNLTALTVNTKAIAHAVATYGKSFSSLNQTPTRKREAMVVVEKKRVGGRFLY